MLYSNVVAIYSLSFSKFSKLTREINQISAPLIFAGKNICKQLDDPMANKKLPVRTTAHRYTVYALIFNAFKAGLLINAIPPTVLFIPPEKRDSYIHTGSGVTYLPYLVELIGFSPLL